MKAVLEFDLSEKEDRIEHLRCVKALSLAIALWDMDQHLRNETKYAPDSMSDEVYEALKQTRDKLHEIMNDNNIDLDELIH